MDAMKPSELLRPILSEHEPQPFQRVVGREKILRIYGVMKEFRARSSIIALASAVHQRTLLSWPEAASVLGSTNAEFQKRAGSLGLVEAGWLETVTNGGTEHVEWAERICNRHHHIVYELPYEWSLKEVFGNNRLLPEDYQGWEWVAFPDCGVLFVSNAALHEGQGELDVIQCPRYPAMIAQAITTAAEKLGQQRSYPELFERCFKRKLPADRAA